MYSYSSALYHNLNKATFTKGLEATNTNEEGEKWALYILFSHAHSWDMCDVLFRAGRKYAQRSMRIFAYLNFSFRNTVQSYNILSKSHLVPYARKCSLSAVKGGGELWETDLCLRAEVVHFFDVFVSVRTAIKMSKSWLDSRTSFLFLHACLLGIFSFSFVHFFERWTK